MLAQRVHLLMLLMQFSTVSVAGKYPLYRPPGSRYDGIPQSGPVRGRDLRNRFDYYCPEPHRSLLQASSGQRQWQVSGPLSSRWASRPNGLVVASMVPILAVGVPRSRHDDVPEFGLVHARDLAVSETVHCNPNLRPPHQFDEQALRSMVTQGLSRTNP